MITTDYNHLSINTSPKSEASQAFDFKMELASKEQSVATKRVYYENLFSTLREDVQNPLQLFKLFEAYATSTCYNQKFNNTKEEGYRRSAKLMEYSFLLQLKHLDLISDDIMDWKSFDSLEELVLNLGNDQDFSSFNKLTLDKDRLHQEAINKEITNTVKDTLVRLAYSFQNIATLTVSNQLNIAIHSKVNELAEQLLENR